jgi:Mobilization protein NikA
MFRKRTRVVSFRISEEEYEDLMDLCAMRQARSLSDFARLATLGQSQGEGANRQSDGTLREVYRQLRALDGEVKRLSALVEPHYRNALLSFRPVEAPQGQVASTNQA